MGLKEEAVKVQYIQVLISNPCHVYRIFVLFVAFYPK